MNPTTLTRVERQSVQELPEVDKNSANFNTSAFWSDVWQRGEILPDPVTRPGERWLRWYDRHNLNTLWHGTKSGMIKKIGATPSEIKGGRNLVSYFDDVLRYAQFGAGMEQMLEMIASDYLVFNGGAYMEIIAPGSSLRAPTGRVTGLAHLDSYACVPTGNPEYPVVYTDRLGKLHLMHHTRIVHFVDTPDGDQNHPGYGRSALWRAIAICQRQILMGRYVVTSLDDKPPPGMLLVGGMTRDKWNAIWAQFRSDQTTDEKPDWGRTVAIFGVDADHAPTVESVAFSSPPDKFDLKVYVELDVHEFALAVGVDIQDLWELTGGNLGSAGQSEIQHAKSRGKTYGEFLATFERAMNNYVLPKSLEFEFKVADPQESAERAQNAQVWLTAIGAAVSSGVVTPDEARRILANQIEAIADAVLDENGELIRITDNDPLDPAQIQALVTDATPLGVQPATEADIPDTSNAVQLSLVKDYAATTAAFASAFTDLVGAAQDGDLTRRRAGTVLRANVSRLGRDAYLEGLKAGGVEEMSDADRNAVAVLTAEQSGYVTAFLDSLGNTPLTPEQAQAHAALWINKSLTPFYQAGLASADADGMYMWVLGEAEHCASCLAMSGQKHRLKEYAANGVLPKSDKLDCGGFNCACLLVKTSGRSKGGWL